MNTRQLLEKRARLVREARDLQDAADASSDGAMTAEQAAAFDKLKAALAELEESMARRALIEDAERRMAGTSISTGGADRSFDAQVRQFSLVRAIAGAAGLAVDCGRENEVSQELARRSGRPFQGIAVPMSALHQPIERRVETTTTPTGLPGGNLVMNYLDGSQYIDLLRSRLVIRQLGARVLSGLTSNVDVPRLAQAAAAGWVAENSALSFSDEGWDHVSLRPKHAGAIVEVSRNLLQQASPDIEQLVRADLAAVLARTLDAAAINGTGLVNDPVGILNQAGIGIVSSGSNGGPLTWPNVLALIETIEQANAQDDSRAFLGNPKIKAQAMQTLKASGVAAGFVMDQPDKLAGYPFAPTTLIPASLSKGSGNNLSALIFGQFSDLLIGMWSELDILVNPYAEVAYVKGNIQIRAMMTIDIAVRHPQSFAAIVDINAP